MATVTNMMSAVRVGQAVTTRRSVTAMAGTKKTFSGGSAKSTREIVGRDLWIPYAEPPAWLDGSLPGDRGFDPLGLSKPTEYLQFDLDGQDINGNKQSAGKLLGRIRGDENVGPTADPLQPYSEVFGLIRFRECEVIHGRWCMLAALGAVVAELTTGVSWVDAGKVELAQTSYLGLDLPFNVTQLTIIEFLAVGGAEYLRNTELDTEKRSYPGGPFDPLGLANEPEQAFRLKTAEIKHGRLAMISVFGFWIQAGATHEGLIDNLRAGF